MEPKLALKGSCKTVTDYFEYAIHLILFQRGIYPAEDFQTVRKYDLPLLVNIDEDVKQYVNKIMVQIKKWIYGNRILKLVLVIVSKNTFESVERWEFNVEVKNDDEDSTGTGATKDKQQTQREIQAIIRQITSLVSYLPILKEDDYTFNVMVYTDPNDTSVPTEWCDTNGDQRMLEGDVEQVKFTSFSTNIHEIGTVVSYKIQE